jgi:superfamily II DNA/RNA helicase
LKDVKAVINMDFPPRYANYVHRVGRTARGDKSGVSFSLVDSQSDAELVTPVFLLFSGFPSA